MNNDELQPIQHALKQGDKAQARRLLKPLLKESPSADLWVLAAKSMDEEDDDKAIACLRKALELDDFHSEANRLLHKIEGAKPRHEQEKERQRQLELEQQKRSGPLPQVNRQMKKDRFHRHEQRQKRWQRLGCLFSILLSVSCSMFVCGAVGLLPGFIGTITQLFGGAPPVYEINGTPIEAIDNAPLIMTPQQNKEASGQGTDILDHGYLHAYTFTAVAGQTYAVYVQFMSFNANIVSRNVVILDSNGDDATGRCKIDTILEGDNGIAFICDTHLDGTWEVRVLGRNGESVGAYFVGVQRLG